MLQGIRNLEAPEQLFPDSMDLYLAEGPALPVKPDGLRDLWAHTLLDQLSDEPRRTVRRFAHPVDKCTELRRF